MMMATPKLTNKTRAIKPDWNWQPSKGLIRLKLPQCKQLSTLIRLSAKHEKPQWTKFNKLFGLSGSETAKHNLFVKVQ